MPASSDNKESDWNYHYVSWFVDRDMLMRYLGGGIVHFNQFPRSEIIERSTYSIDDEGEEMDLNERETEIETNIELDAEGCSRGGDTAGVDPNAERDGWYEEDGDTDSSHTGSDGELEDEVNDDFIVDLYDL